MKASLKNLHPFVGKHWRKGAVGVILILVTSLLGIPQPLIMRYLVDDVILGNQLGLLAVAILLLAGILLAEKLTGLLQEFYFARFEQQVTLDIQQDLFNHVLRFPKTFFDEKQTGYLMSRLSSDVEGLRWFFSSTIVYIISNILRFAVLPGMETCLWCPFHHPRPGTLYKVLLEESARSQPPRNGEGGHGLKSFAGVTFLGLLDQSLLHGSSVS
jgi:ABC-type bacteriocin/lantibiotic exporter with double-glycine peptidase domain